MVSRFGLPVIDDDPMLFDAPLIGWFPASAPRCAKRSVTGSAFARCSSTPRSRQGRGRASAAAGHPSERYRAERGR
jgi:hypothetical protein